MSDIITAFLLGLLWMTMTGYQTRLLVKSDSDWLLFGWAMITSLVWGFLVRTVTLNASVIIPYAIGTAIGAVIARKLKSKKNGGEK